jgi:hypothetical protein
MVWATFWATFSPTNLVTLPAAAVHPAISTIVGNQDPVGSVTRDRCYDFKNIFAKKFCEKISVFDSKQS